MTDKIPNMITAPTQEIFDFVYEKLMEQGKGSMATKIQCAYRADDGCKCAIGHLIPDEKYTTDIEGFAADGLYGKDIFLDGEHPSENRKQILYHLQRAHDSTSLFHKDKSFKSTFHNKMVDIARNHNLQPPT